MKNLEAFLILSKDLRLERSKDSINTRLFRRLEVDQHEVCELQRSGTALRLSSLCLPDIIVHDLKTSQAFSLRFRLLQAIKNRMVRKPRN